ncbi:MAG TPA: hypothetical protein VLE99_01060 [Candidatus Saccharimonadales bacterium]|nr:hypothetical protein [Candidatus Saccharimonadales bacterium]
MKKVARKVGFTISGLLILLLGGGAAWAMHYGAGKLPIRRYFPANYTNAVWDWSNIENKTAVALKNQANFMHMHQLNAVYVDIGAYASIVGEKDEAQRTTDQQKLESAIVRYVTALQGQGIRVYAAAGDTHWSDAEKQYIPLAILLFAQDYNAHHPKAQLAGVEFDVESYNQEGFSTGSVTVKSLVLVDYLTMVDRLVQANLNYVNRTHATFELGFAIPYWFDNENGNIPSVTWQEKTGPVLFHLLDRLNALPRSNVVVMAYRNAARGSDGVIAHARTEVDYAQAKAPRIRVMIGQEVNDVQPAKITYFGSSHTELSAQFEYIKDELGPSGVLGGIAINDLAGYQAMEDGD